jgi:hypothetical protein
MDNLTQKVTIENPSTKKEICVDCKNTQDAAKKGHLECLIYAYENRWEWDESTCANAASNGHLECLIYAHEKGCPWDVETCVEAVVGGHIDCLQYVHDKGFIWDEFKSLLINMLLLDGINQL